MMIKSIKLNPTINIKPIATLLAFAMAFLCAITINVEAETLTYEVCDTCEYTNLSDVKRAINNISDLSDKDIVINVNSDRNSSFGIDYGTIPKSITINGNYHDFTDFDFNLSGKKIEINNCRNLDKLGFDNVEKVTIKNSNINYIYYLLFDNNGQIILSEGNLSNILNIDEYSLSNLKYLFIVGNIKIENMNLSNTTLLVNGGKVNIYNTKLNKIFNLVQNENINISIYNSIFKNLKYTNITSEEDKAYNEYVQFYLSNYSSVLSNDIYDVDLTNFGGETKSTTTVYFDKEAKLKLDDKLNLVNYLDYYTDDKEIEYTIEDESIAKIENKELTALKEGSTKVTVTTDEGHVVYNINLVVEKETLPEKIDKMTIKVPITGSKIRVWVVIVSVILLAVILLCSYMLIKRKKVK